MRFGAPVMGEFADPGKWAAAVRAKGYRAAMSPLSASAENAKEAIAAYRRAAEDADIVIAEVGAWSNPLGPDPAEREKAFANCFRALSLADEIGALCAVNIAGSRGAKWDGPDARDMEEETFEMIVGSIRRIVDEVKPLRAKYAVETMPWMHPYDAESALRLMKAVDRPKAAIHFDPVNMVSSPLIYFDNGKMIRDFAAKLRKWIVSAHCKDIVLRPNLTTHLDECVAGEGNLDYRAFLTALETLDPDIPLLLEHLKSEADYDRAAAHVRKEAKACGIDI